MLPINTRAQFVALASVLGMRADWHEPDEQEVNARVEGDHLDNAMGASGDSCGELRVVFTKEGADVAVVNLATLCAWASEARPTIVTHEVIETEVVSIRGRF